MKLFVSMSMNGLDDSILRTKLNEHIENIKSDENLKDDIKTPIEVINTIDHLNAPKNASRLWYLGESIKKLSEAEMVYFADDWYKANGCWVEFIAAHLYLDKARIIFDYPNDMAGQWFISVLDNLFDILAWARGTEQKETSSHELFRV